MTRCTFYLCLSLALLLSAGAAQDSFSFPSPAANSDSFSNYASHDNPTWRDFRDFIKHPVYGSIGTPVGRLNLTYEGQDSFELYDGGNCTATIISERLVISNAHCVYSPRYSPSAGETIRLTNLSLAMDVHAASETGDVYPIKIEPIELNETLDFAILEFAAASPYDTYGAVDLSNHRSANVGESLFMIHHSNITGRFDGTNYKRITESNCTRLNASQFENNNIPILMPDEENKRPVNPTQDIPHFCDSEQGSSGSLIYARDDSAVVGLHFSGRNARDEADRFNLYVDIEAICSQSRVLPRFCTPQQGSLTVTSSPSGATVSIDGQVIGTTPLQNQAYDVGIYELSVDADGYQLYSESIRIATGQVLQRDIALEAREPEIIRTAEQLVRRAKDGGTLKLAGVTFRLDAPLELSGDVALLGEGYEETRIVSSAPEYVVRYAGGGTFVAQGIGFEYTGVEKAVVMHVDDGILDIDSCQFTGGKRIDDSRGTGLWVKGSTQGKVKHSIFNSNDLHGVSINDNAQVVVEQNYLHNNVQAGIRYAGESTGSVFRNKSYSNGAGANIKGNSQPKLEDNDMYNNIYGITVIGNAQPEIKNNRVYDNTESGIAYFDLAGGIAVGNESYGNGKYGITLRDSVQPRLEQNHLHNNVWIGISYFESAGGSAIGNESYSNLIHGIGVQDDAQPILEQNRLYDNVQVGIRYSGSAGGRAVANESYQNNMHGISVQDNATPILEQNNLHNNNESGIIYFNSAGGNATRNTGYRNGAGITVVEDAQPMIEHNHLYENMLSGITYFDSAGGSAVGNESYNNGYHGISIKGDARPTISSNESYQNEYHGIRVGENAQPILEQNRLHDNMQAGIVYRDFSGGSALNNESYNNNRWGIYVYETANPTLSNNTAYNNPDGDIVDER